MTRRTQSRDDWVLGRAILVGAVALLTAWQVVRTALVSAFVEAKPELAAQAWSSHPQVNLALAMAEIGRAAAGGKRAIPSTATRRMRLASRRDPLAVAPFLIAGTIAKNNGQEAIAENLFAEAKRRDPRSAAARYFLAERYLSSGRADQGLNEMSALIRLVPGGAQLVAPGLAKYALTPGATPHLRKMFAANRGVGELVLTELAADAGNAGLIMQIAGTRGSAEVAPPVWQGRLLNALIERGDYGRAELLWSKFSGIRRSNPHGPINEAFATINAPPPFNWTFGSSSFGVAEPSSGGQLKVIFYGRDDGELASQLMVLPAGQYRIGMLASSDADGDSGLEWSVTCLPGKAKLAGVPLRNARVAGAKLGAAFTVPAQGCAAQWLRLVGKAGGVAKSEQATIAGFDLSPAGAR